MTYPDNAEPWHTRYPELESTLLAAHEKGDKVALVDLYTLAADAAERHNDTLAARFYLTQAYVISLELGSELHTVLQYRLDIYHQRGSDSENIS